MGVRTDKACLVSTHSLIQSDTQHSTFCIYSTMLQIPTYYSNKIYTIMQKKFTTLLTYIHTSHLVQTRHALSVLVLLFPIFLFAQSPIIPNYDDIPDTLETVNYVQGNCQELIREKVQSYKVKPPIFETKKEQFLLKEGYSGYKKPIYKTVTRKIPIKVRYQRIKVIPPTYQWQEEIVMVRTSINRLRKKQKPNPFTEACYDTEYSQLDTCHWEFFEVPPIYYTHRWQVVKDSTQLEYEYVPAKFTELHYQQLDRAATEKQQAGDSLITIKEAYKEIYKYILVEKAIAEPIEIPAVYRTTKCYQRGDGFPNYGILLERLTKKAIDPNNPYKLAIPRAPDPDLPLPEPVDTNYFKQQKKQNSHIPIPSNGNGKEEEPDGNYQTYPKLLPKKAD